jgi:acyl carrier protein
MKKESIFEIVLSTVNNLVETLPYDQTFEVNRDTILFGNGSSIDSLSLVCVIVDIETTLSLEYGLEISLTDDRAMTREISPFDNVSRLVDYIYEILNE